MPAKFSILKFGEWQLSGKQIDIMTALLRPLPAVDDVGEIFRL
jgi:hypothetical protein